MLPDRLQTDQWDSRTAVGLRFEQRQLASWWLIASALRVLPVEMPTYRDQSRWLSRAQGRIRIDSDWIDSDLNGSLPNWCAVTRVLPAETRRWLGRAGPTGWAWTTVRLVARLHPLASAAG